MRWSQTNNVCSAKINKWIKSALCPRAHTGWKQTLKRQQWWWCVLECRHCQHLRAHLQSRVLKKYMICGVIKRQNSEYEPATYQQTLMYRQAMKQRHQPWCMDPSSSFTSNVNNINHNSHQDKAAQNWRLHIYCWLPHETKAPFTPLNSVE